MPLFAFKKAERWRTYRQSPHDLNHRRPCARVGLDSPANDQPPKNASVESSPSTQRIHNTPKTGVFVADTYKMWRDALAVVINGAPDLQVTGEAATGDEAVSLCRRMRPDIVVMSIELEGLGGIDVTQQIMRERPDTKVILIQASSDEDTTVRAIRSGALGLVFRNDPATHLLEALEAVKQGHSYLGPLAWGLVLQRHQRRTRVAGAGHLSPREMQILRLIVRGKTSKEIAGMLEVSVQTVLSQRQSLMQKMGAKNVAGLIFAAMAKGLNVP